jgi:hypothetical protein
VTQLTELHRNPCMKSGRARLQMKKVRGACLAIRNSVRS